MPAPQPRPPHDTDPNVAAKGGRCIFAWLTVWAMILAALTRLALY